MNNFPVLTLTMIVLLNFKIATNTQMYWNCERFWYWYSCIYVHTYIIGWNRGESMRRCKIL